MCSNYTPWLLDRKYFLKPPFTLSFLSFFPFRSLSFSFSPSQSSSPSLFAPLFLTLQKYMYISSRMRFQTWPRTMYVLHHTYIFIFHDSYSQGNKKMTSYRRQTLWTFSNAIASCPEIDILRMNIMLVISTAKNIPRICWMRI